MTRPWSKVMGATTMLSRWSAVVRVEVARNSTVLAPAFSEMVCSRTAQSLSVGVRVNVGVPILAPFT